MDVKYAKWINVLVFLSSNTHGLKLMSCGDLLSHPSLVGSPTTQSPPLLYVSHLHICLAWDYHLFSQSAQNIYEPINRATAGSTHMWDLTRYSLRASIETSTPKQMSCIFNPSKSMLDHPNHATYSHTRSTFLIGRSELSTVNIQRCELLDDSLFILASFGLESTTFLKMST